METLPDSLRLSRQQYPAIDVLRAFAALAVVACHCVVVGQWPAEPLGVIAHFARYGWLGVDLFFVISGFVITSAALQLSLLNWRDYACVFWIRRIARIVPLYYFTSIAYLVLVDHRPIVGGDAFKQIASHLMLSHQWWPETSGSINPVTWTLGIEWLFYLIAWVLVGFRAVSAGRGAALIGFIVAASVGYRVLVFQLQPIETLRIFWSNQVFGLLDGFMLGTAIAVCPGSKKRSFATPAEAFYMRPWFLLVAGILVLALCFWLVDFYLADFWQHRFIVGGFRTLVAAAFALLVLGAIRWQQEVVPRFLEFLGKISYGIYLWHLIILLWLQKSVGISGSDLIFATLFLTFLVSCTTYYLLEIPFQRWGARACVKRLRGKS